MNWKSKLPPWECQYSAKTHTDAEDCVSESLCHVVYMLTSRRYSARALGCLSNTTPTGNYTNIVQSAANNFGLVPYDLWPTPDDFTWELYYTPVPQPVLNKAERLNISLVPVDLNVSPSWTEIGWGVGTPQFESHMVAQIDDTEYFDSEMGDPVKPINYLGAQVVWRTSVQISTEGMLLTQLLGLSNAYADTHMSVDEWSYYWSQILGAPVDGGLLMRVFPTMTGTDRLSLTAAQFATAVLS